MNDVHRPITSRARGICKYYTTIRGCFAGDSCKFLHTTEPPVDPSGSRPPVLTPYDKAKRCKYYAEGYCKKGANCWFLHVMREDLRKPGQAEKDDEEFCSICFEKPSIYGLLGGCSHIFCIECIRQWRDPAGKGGEIDNTKKCPMCRAMCRYIIPSSRFWKEGQEEKAQVVQKYKKSMSKVPCKHFAASKKNSSKPMCPFGKDCFYQHLNDDGTPHIFKYGIDRSMREWRNSMQRNSSFGPFSFITGDGVNFRTPFGVDFIPDVGGSEDAVNMAGTIAMDLFDRMVAQVSAGRERGGAPTRGRRRRDNFREELDRARMEMVAGAVSAARGAPHRAETLPNQNLRPLVVPGTLAPSHWDLDGDGEEVDNGWGWNDLVTEAAHNGNIDVMERLELLANHMLGSTRIVRGRDTESSPPPLEPIRREDTPPPPLIPVDTGEQVDDDDGMPPLESVSNSSESEDEGSDEEQNSDYTPTDRVQRAERTPNLAFDLTQRLEEARPPPSRSPGDAAHAPSTRSRFSTIVEREEARADTDADEECEANDERGTEAQETDPSPAVATNPPTPSEPPFVTDGRGRVVWSNKDAETAPEPPYVEPAGESQPRATGSRSLLGRVFDAFIH